MKDNRLFRILYYILEKEKVTANELADKFEVSIRTIYRDIDSISSVGVPIFTTQGKGGGIKIDNEFILNKSLFDTNEKEQIIAALQGLEKTNEAYKSELITKLSALFKIKNSNWIEIDFTSWGSNNTYQDLFNTLKIAIINKNIIFFSYISSKAEKINRRVKPIRLLFKEQDWYLYAFCLLRNDFRYFKLSRIKDLEVLAINYEDNFENEVLKKELKYENIVNIKLKFDKSVAFRVYDEFNEAIVEDEKANLYVEIKIPNNYKLYNYIFSFGANVEILEPEEIRTQFKNMINKIAKKYI
ncbi:helix-turn-helix transcriptional regulator [Fusobacterium hwasookii]|uniref:Helix-turn-helix type 11 domain-containing protein n=1 Tax=Fusobacterium hwasookii ChDC F128 TaxID=1216362 RepID=A0ABP2R389_9FUSO|nr:YafY family protein [Fusobacterium hwasookii]EJU07148.1 helix-turn-helix type 11 domain-containing protein [Fusobacterium hwasookii ChDC F128]QNE66473.1 YafY family transcriptional regulator [Fusobacterium hwasookii]